MIIKCRECGKEISDKAVSCPNCGFPLQETKSFDINESEKEKCKFCENGIIGKDGYCDKCGSPKEDFLTKSLLIQQNNKEKQKSNIFTAIGIIIYAIIFISVVSSCINSETTDTLETTNSIPQETTVYDYEEINTETTETEQETEIEITEEEPIPTFEEYVVNCQEYKYKDVLRNPSDYIGKKAKIEIEISSVHEESLFNAGKYYFGYSKSEDLDLYMGDRYAIFDNRFDASLKLLEGDVIMVYGEISEPEYTSSIIVNSEELFCIDMKFVELISE